MFCELPLIKFRDRNPAYMPSDIEWSLLADDVGDGVVLVSLLCGWRSVIQAVAVPTELLPCSSNALRLFFKSSSNVLLFCFGNGLLVLQMFSICSLNLLLLSSRFSKRSSLFL
ncbi:hypothetical protein ACLH0B_06440 [Aeromonas salmonicida]|uniref:hypothetical protein n=1 Tax=Aeromonas salmonicida TaxID=645 RepID=UPI003D03461A